jgi:DNA replicative helicase MCM subunit Mcm2 (Cdc46/Mcm family)
VLCLVQERPEDVPTGELPRNILLAVDRCMVGTIAPGTRVTAVGIYSTFQVHPLPHEHTHSDTVSRASNWDIRLSHM